MKTKALALVYANEKAQHLYVGLQSSFEALFSLYRRLDFFSWENRFVRATKSNLFIFVLLQSYKSFFYRKYCVDKLSIYFLKMC